MPTVPATDKDLLHKLLLGQLPTAEVERLATEYATDDRLSSLAESLIDSDDDLLGMLRHHEAAVVDPEGERWVDRLLERLKSALPPNDTAVANQSVMSTEPQSPNMTGKPASLPANLDYYRPIKILGQGGMGTVYLAEDTRLGREVAIKTLRPELAINPQAKERFLREARTAAKLEHDHIIPIYSVGEADGTPFLAMPFLKGEPLDSLIRRSAGPLPVALVLRLARETASGLAAAHERGLIHRDIKPANIWLEAPTGRVKILDFGLAKAADACSESDTETNLTASGAIVGTPAYMAPEQASGHPVDGRADLFSLGCVLYEVLSGKRAFSGPNTMSILMSLANHTPAAPETLSSDCPAGLSKLVMKLLEKNPANRPESAAAVIQALETLQATATTRNTDTLELQASATDVLSQLASALGSTPPGPPSTNSPSAVSRDGASGQLANRTRIAPRSRIAIALCGAVLAALAAVVYVIKSDEGTLVVEINDSQVQAILEKEGLIIRDKDSNIAWTITTTKTSSVKKSLKSGDYQVEGAENLQLQVTDANGAETTTDKFTLKRKGETRIVVSLQSPSVPADKQPIGIDPNRRGAEWVLSLGGGISIEREGQIVGVATVDELPKDAFELTGLFFTNIHGITDAGLASVKGCRKLKHIKLNNAWQVTDKGLSNLQDSLELESLDLTRVAVTDEGLNFFKNGQGLKQLDLSLCAQVSDAGVANFKGCNLNDLDLSSTKVTDAGMVNFSKCTALSNSLNLSDTVIGDMGLAHLPACDPLVVALIDTRVTDAGLAHFKNCRRVEILYLSGAAKVSDAGLPNFQYCQKLRTIHLDRTAVTDAVLDQCAAFPNLVELNLTKSHVTEGGVKKLAAALPKCKIEWDGGVIEPSTNPDQRVAE